LPPACALEESHGERLSEFLLPGIFPPQWKKGDTWRIQFDDRTQGGAKVSRAGQFRVVDVPSGERDVYTLSFISNSERHREQTVTFRGRSRSVIQVNGLQTIDSAERPFTFGSAPVFAFPVWPHKLINPLLFHIELEAHESHDDGLQTIRKDGPDAVEIDILMRGRWQYATARRIMRWQRGDPWWSYVRCYEIGYLGQDQHQALSELTTCSATLLREPEAPKGKPQPRP
jgi:hypothetical protein